MRIHSLAGGSFREASDKSGREDSGRSPLVSSRLVTDPMAGLEARASPLGEGPPEKGGDLGGSSPPKALVWASLDQILGQPFGGTPAA